MLKGQERRDTEHNRACMGDKMHVCTDFATEDTQDCSVNDKMSNFATCDHRQSPGRVVTRFTPWDANRIQPGSGNRKHQ